MNLSFFIFEFMSFNNCSTDTQSFILKLSMSSIGNEMLRDVWWILNGDLSKWFT